jgi:hypothetical protein
MLKNNRSLQILTRFLLTTVILLGLTVTTTAATFTDVDNNHEFTDGIEFLAEMGIVNGNPDGSFAPEKVLNRAELIKMVAEGAATYYSWPENVFEPYATESCFSDISANQWFTKYVCYGKAQGWVKGYSDNTYRPSQDVTFVEALKITLKGFDLGYTETTEPWYRDGVELASENNYIPYNVDGFNIGFKKEQMADLITRIVRSNISFTELDVYLGSRANVVVTYDSILEGLDLSQLKEEEISTS